MDNTEHFEFEEDADGDMRVTSKECGGTFTIPAEQWAAIEDVEELDEKLLMGMAMGAIVPAYAARDIIIIQQWQCEEFLALNDQACTSDSANDEWALWAWLIERWPQLAGARAEISTRNATAPQVVITAPAYGARVGQAGVIRLVPIPGAQLKELLPLYFALNDADEDGNTLAAYRMWKWIEQQYPETKVGQWGLSVQQGHSITLKERETENTVPDTFDASEFEED